jgi:hypothetical protein
MIVDAQIHLWKANTSDRPCRAILERLGWT